MPHPETKGRRRAAARARPKPGSATETRYRIQAIDRAVALLDCFVDRQELNVRDLSERTGLHKSTAHRILMAMQYNGLIEQDPASGRYHLGLKLVKLGEYAVRRLDLRLVARPYIEELAARARETIHLGVMDGDKVVMIDRVDGPDPSSTLSLPGRLFPLHCTALGKAMLAGLDDHAVVRLVGSGPLQRFTPKTLTSVSALLADLEATRQRGYAVTDEEIGVGLRTVGAAVRNHQGVIAGAVSIAVPSARGGEDVLEALGKLVKETAAAVSARLGHTTRLDPLPAGRSRR